MDKFHAGDISARDVLVKHNLRLIVYIAKKYTNYPDKDELISVGTIGLIKAINTFNKEKNIKLAKVDIDENEELIRKFKIMSVPTLKIFKAGKEVCSSVGLISENRLLELLDNIDN